MKKIDNKKKAAPAAQAVQAPAAANTGDMFGSIAAEKAYEDLNPVMKLLRKIGPFNFFAVSMVTAFFAQNMMFNMKKAGPALWVYGISAVFFVLAQLASSRKFAPEGMNKKLELGLFAVVILLAFYFRFHSLNSMPAGCFADEAQNGREAVNIINGEKIEGSILPVFISRDSSTNPAYYIYIMAAAQKLFGVSCTTVRGVSAITGVLTVIAFYFLVRYMFGAKIAVLSAMLLASLRWHVNFSRIGFHAVFGVFMLVLVLYFTYRMYKERKWQDFILFGFILALSQYSYIASRTVPVAIAVFFAFLLVRDFAFYRQNLLKLAVAAGIALITFLPLGTYMMKNWNMFMARQRQVSILNEGTMKNWFMGKFNQQQLLANNFRITVLQYHMSGDSNPRHNWPGRPVLDFFTGTLVFMGFLFLLTRVFTPHGFLLSEALWVFMLPGILTIEAPQALRTIFCLPVMMLMAATVLERGVTFAKEQYGNLFKKIFLVVLGLAAVAVMLGNWDDYFNKAQKNSDTWTAFSTYERETAEYLRALGPGWHAYIQSSFMCNTFNYCMIGWNEKNYEMFEPGNSIPARDNGKSAVYILDAAYEPIIPMLKSMYPNGKYIPVPVKYNEQYMYFIKFEVPYEDIKAFSGRKIKNGLTGYYYNGHEWKGNLAMKRVDPFILFEWTADPVPGGFSVEWRGRIDIVEPGEYTFIMKSNDFSDVSIDGKTVVTNTRYQSGMGGTSGKTRLAKGTHRIKVRYYESITGTKVQMWWVRPGQTKPEVVPHEALLPER